MDQSNVRGELARGQAVGFANKEQISLWDGRLGGKWADWHIHLDLMMTGVTKALNAALGPIVSSRVLDIGCGTGETCALWLANGAVVTGVDVSQAMLGIAAQRTNGNARLVHADASTWCEPAAFDLVVSRFGLTFFDAPDAAFANIAANLRPGGRLVFCCWRAKAHNAWIIEPAKVLSELEIAQEVPLQSEPAPWPPAPGPFAFACDEHIEALLRGCGFSAVQIRAIDTPVFLAAENGVEAALAILTQFGPTGAALANLSGNDLQQATARLRQLLRHYEKDGRVEMGGAIWMVEARLDGAP